MTTMPGSFAGTDYLGSDYLGSDNVGSETRRGPAGLDGASRTLAVCFWTAFVITVVIGASLTAVTASSQMLSALCGSGCHRGYQFDALLQGVVTYAEPALVVASLLGWLLARREPRTAGTTIYAVVLTAQLALTGWIIYAAYALFMHH